MEKDKKEAPVRLDKFLVSQSVGSRKEVSQLIRKGAVAVNGQIGKDSAAKIIPTLDKVCLHGRPVVYRKHLYLMMNKPSGVLSATQDKKAKTVLDLLPEEFSRRGLFPAGRLDKDTTGLLLITDDGELAHRMLSPKSHVYKLYEVTTRLPVTQEDVAAFERGVEWGGVQYAPARLRFQMENTGNISYVEIREGKFHQVKRMYEARGNKVTKLKRLKIGGLALDETLPEGEVRLLGEAEIGLIFT